VRISLATCAVSVQTGKKGTSDIGLFLLFWLLEKLGLYWIGAIGGIIFPRKCISGFSLRGSLLVNGLSFFERDKREGQSVVAG
jgi:hypothetical protein